LRRLPVILAVLAAAGVAPAPAGAWQALEPGQLPVLPPAEVFPVAGPVHYGQVAARFGGGRGHDGQDVFAACGTPVLALEAGEVVRNAYDGAGGNYLVVRTAARRAHVYMHLRRPARRSLGARVRAGERLGAVGDTGDAWDCHLHLELWTAPGWYRGGHPLDPLPLLRRLQG
jgi:murein DD-endopeptidase MepM/ murein hydrolase activator NlpD